MDMRKTRISRKQSYILAAYFSFVVCTAALSFYLLFVKADLNRHPSSGSVDVSKWLPGRTYSPAIEAGLSVLARYAPEKVAFVRKMGMPIIVCTREQWTQQRLRQSTLGFTREPDGTLEVDGAQATTPDRLALVLYHELIHEQWHIHDPSVYQPSMVLRFIAWNEEATAHIKTLFFAWRHYGAFSDASVWLLTGPWPRYWFPVALFFELLIHLWPLGSILLILSVNIPIWMKAHKVAKRNLSFVNH